MERVRKSTMMIKMMLHRPNPKLTVSPNQLDCIQRVNTFKFPGLVLTPDLNFNDHVSSVVTICNQKLFGIFLLC
jgi:hypothetical protein